MVAFCRYTCYNKNEMSTPAHAPTAEISLVDLGLGFHATEDEAIIEALNRASTTDEAWTVEREETGEFWADYAENSLRRPTTKVLLIVLPCGTVYDVEARTPRIAV